MNISEKFDQFSDYFNELKEYLPMFADGLWNTFYICFLAVIIGMVIGGFLYFLSTHKNILSRIVYRTYVLIFRGTPLLVQVFIVFNIAVAYSAVQIGIVCLSLYAAAYFAEIYRSGFATISPGQLESAKDIGLSRIQTLFYIQIPQLFGAITPPMTNQTIILIKESAILSIISVAELKMAAEGMANDTYDFVSAYIILALIYWGLTFLVSKIGILVEKKTTNYLKRA